MKVREVTIRRIKMPLDRPYPLSFNRVDMADFDAIVAEVRDEDGRSGWGEVTILPGYTHETVASGLEFCHAHGRAILGRRTLDAKRHLISYVADSPHAVNPLLCAIEMLEDNPILRPEQVYRVPVLAPVRFKDEVRVPEEVEQLLAKKHRTLKIKVGFDVDRDLSRIALIKKVAAGRARLRVDANQGYSRSDGCRFASALDPEVVDWFEQPCDLKDWESNAAVAKVSAVPVMLDESIYSFVDIQRAAGIEGVGFIKHVIEKFGGLDLLKAALEHITICGMKATVGNGGATDITSWMEACVARLTVDIPCEMHGFLKVQEPLLMDPLPFEDGDIVLRPDYRPTINRQVLEKYTTSKERFANGSA
jgi:L-alanine-DL-glutamate epimerase-like enolase superfamily enzyme